MPTERLTRVTVNMPPSLANRLRRAAAAQQVTLSALICSRLDKRLCPPEWGRPTVPAGTKSAALKE
jgi:hypothetical protein